MNLLRERRTARVPTGAAALCVEELSVHYGGVRAVGGVSFSVEPGQSLGIIGANGAGKTSTLKALMGLVPRSSGRLTLGDVDISRVPARDMVRLGIGYVPEGRHVFSGLTVENNLLLGAYTANWRTHTGEPLNDVYELFPVLRQMRSRLAGALSGGQQQMLAVAQGLVRRPRLLMLDEPSAGLSPVLVDRVFVVVRRLRENGTAVLLVEQLIEKALALADRVYALARGAIVLEAKTGEADLPARLEHAYLASGRVA
jgi:branched-chain amino acid transport system ATP-binding protein